MNPNKSVDNLLQKGYQYLEQGKCSQAFEVFDYINNSFLDNERVKYALGLTCLVQEQHKIIGFNSPDSRQFELSVKYFDKAIKLQPNYLPALAKRGTVLGLLGKNELALKDCDRVLKSKLETNLDWYSAGTVFFATSKVEQALQCYEKALALKLEDSESLLHKALCLEGLQQFDLAIASYQKTLRISPNKILALINYGRLLANLNKNEEALQCFDKALSVNSNSCAVLLWRGIFLEELDQLQEALQSIDLALKKYKKNAFLWGYKGRILRKMQKRQDALFCLERALSINPDFTFAKEEKSKLILVNSKDNQSVDKKDLKTEFESIEQYIYFLLSLFHVYNNGGGKEQIYSLLLANLDKLNLNLAKAIKFWMFDVFSPRTHSREEELSMAGVILDLSSAILIFPHGDISDNTEIAIVGYQTVISLFPKQKFPRKWLTAQNNLVMAFWQRKVGDTKDNIESSIEACQSALEIATEGKYPFDWSGVQQNLAIAYLYRIEGVKRKNLELAKNAVENALKIRTEHKYPREWAEAQNNLGLIYSNRIEGDRKENIRQAIIAYKNAMKVREEHKLRTKLAETQNNIACAYLLGTTDNRQENIELAISYFEKAHKVYTKSDFPYMWAGVNTNLGLAYISRLDNPSKNAKLAISVLKSALEIRTIPYDRAETQLNLGIAYLHHKEPSQQQKNIERAIEVFLLALGAYTKDNVPLRWAKIQVNLGDAYSKRTLDNKQDNTQKAVDYYLAALTVYTSQDNPLEYLIAARKLGQLAFDKQDWQLAIQAYSGAIEAIETSRSWSTDDLRRQEVISNAISVYQNIVQAYINLGQIDKAIECVERSKARNLVDLLAARDLYPKGDIRQKVIARLDSLRKEAVAEEKLLNQQRNLNNSFSGLFTRDNRGIGSNISNTEALDRTRLNSLYRELENLIDREIRPIDPGFQLTQRVESIRFSKIKELLLSKQTVSVEWFVGKENLSVFIVSADREQPSLVSYTRQEYQVLYKQFERYLCEYQQKGSHWSNHLNKLFPQLAQNLKIETIVKKVQQLIPDCDRLILVPHRWLHLLPIHALPLSDGKCLLDLFSQGVSYAPSFQLLQLTQKQNKHQLTNLFAVENPTEDRKLKFTSVEVTAIRSQFKPNDDVLKGKEGHRQALTKERLAQTNCTHFSCHGRFNFEHPELSALLLANSRVEETSEQSKTEDKGDDTRFIANRDGGSIDLEHCLTLGEIFSLDLPNCRLVTLSACETGLTDFRSLSDEYIGLPSGFLYAGSPSVVSSLWTVSDLSTSFLMIKFYQNLREIDFVPIALNQAQLWLRDLTKEELEEWRKTLDIGWRMSKIDRLLVDMPNNSRPFASPYHWAAFCAVGS